MDMEKERFECNSCDKTYATKSALADHQKLKHGHAVLEFRCDFCLDKTFMRKSSLQKHIKQNHGDKLNVKCSRCGDRFKDELGLRNHTNRVHGKKKSTQGQQGGANAVTEDDTESNEQTVPDDMSKSWSQTQKQKLVDTCDLRIFTAGKFNAGKTSLARSLFQDKPVTTAENDRTRVVNCNQWQVDEHTTIPIFDLGGHTCYEYCAHFFHKNCWNNLGLLAHDITKMSDDDIEDTFRWSRDILTHSPKCQLWIVLTKIDKVDLSVKDKNKKTFCDKMTIKLDREIEELKYKMTKNKKEEKERLNDMVTALENVKQYLANVSMVSCVTNTGIAQLKIEITSIAKNDKCKQQIPEHWKKFYGTLGKLGVGEDVNTNITTDSQSQSSTSLNSSEVQLPAVDYMDYDKAFEIFQCITTNYLSSQQDEIWMKIDFEKCLETLSTLGMIMWFNETEDMKKLIFNDIGSFVTILKTVFNHNWDIPYESLHSSQKIDIESMKNKFNKELKTLKSKGVMSKQLLKIILRDAFNDKNVEEKLLNTMIKIFCHIGICHPMSNKDFFFPCFCDKSEKPEDISYIHNFKTDELNMIFGIKLSGNIPKAMFHRLMVSLLKQFGIAEHHLRECWKDGMYVKNENLEIMLSYNQTHGVKLTFKPVFEKDESRNNKAMLRRMWIYIREMHTAIEALRKKRWPGLASEIVVVCPHCVMLMKDTLKEFDLDDCIHHQQQDSDGQDPWTCPYDKKVNLPALLLFPLPKVEQLANIQLEALLKYLDAEIKKLRKGSGKFEQKDESKVATVRDNPTQLPHQEVLRTNFDKLMNLSYTTIKPGLVSRGCIHPRQHEELDAEYKNHGNIATMDMVIEILSGNSNCKHFTDFLKILSDNGYLIEQEILQTAYNDKIQTNKVGDHSEIEATLPKRPKIEKSKCKISLNWKHFNKKEKKFTIVRPTAGGGSRSINIPATATRAEIMANATTLFFPKGESNYGKLKEMNAELHFQGSPFPDDNTVENARKETHVKLLSFCLVTKYKETTEDANLRPYSDSSQSSQDTQNQTHNSLFSSDESNEKHETINDDKQHIHTNQRPNTSYHGTNQQPSTSYHHHDTNQQPIVSSHDRNSGYNVSPKNSATSYHGIGHQLINKIKKKITLHQGQCMEEMIQFFKIEDTDIRQHEFIVEIVSQLGSTIQPDESETVLLNALSQFWEEFYMSCTEGRMLKVPVIRNNFQEKEWQAVAKIIVLGWVKKKYFPVELSHIFLNNCLSDNVEYKGNIDELNKEFLCFLQEDEEKLLKGIMDNYDLVEENKDELIEIFQTYGCRTIPTSRNISRLIYECAHREIVQKPSYIKEQWNHIFSQYMLDEEIDLKQVKQQMLPNVKGIIDSFNVVDSSNEDTKDTAKYLNRFIKEIDLEHMKLFLRFVTGCDLLLGKSITIVFEDREMYDGAPKANTCGRVLTLNNKYENYPQFRKKFKYLLKNLASTD